VATTSEAVLYGWHGGFYTFSVTRAYDRFCILVLLMGLLVALGPASAQESGQKPTEPADKATKEKAATPEKNESKPEFPFQIQLLETHVRFENNGDSRKEVHTIVKINDILGAHQFARLTFDYNRAFQQVEIPLVRISHANGGTSELLPSAVTDAPNPAVEKFPAYQDVRVKSVRILGLQEGDTIEYRVITTTTKHPLAPDFWLEHTFDRSGQVLEEQYELDLPKSRIDDREPIESSYRPDWPLNLDWPGMVRMRVSAGAPTPSKRAIGAGDQARLVYQWHVFSTDARHATANEESVSTQRDIVVSTFSSWRKLGARLGPHFLPPGDGSFNEMAKKLYELEAAMPGKTPQECVYAFVARKIKTVDLPLGSTGFQLRHPSEVLSSGYGTPEDKIGLFAALARPAHRLYHIVFSGDLSDSRPDPPEPSLFRRVLVRVVQNRTTSYLDPSLEVAPFGALLPEFRGKAAFILQELLSTEESAWWTRFSDDLPFKSTQKVTVDATISRSGELKAKVKYTLRGDNELLLRVAFHQTTKEKWKDVAGLLAISDGFRGQVSSVNVSDPMETKDPFTVEYEITQPKFVDWTKKPVRIPALLPQIGLPDLPAKTAGGEAAHAIELGTPLDVDTQMTLKLPPGVKVETPAGTSVQRDYATFSSKYSATASTVTASRRVHFLLREISGDRAMDYNAFVRAVQNDQAQRITLVGAVAPAEVAKPAKIAPKE
jgi:hypothetical protein